MDAQLRWLSGLSLVLIALTGALWFLEPAEELADPEADSPIWTVVPSEVVRVQIERASDTVVAERREAAWQLTAPTDWPADTTVIEDLLNDLSELDRGVPIDVEPSQFGEFGLGQPPEATVTLTTAEGLTQTLRVGTVAPIGFRTYVLAADGTVAAGNGEVTPALLDPAMEFRDHRVFAFEPAQVRRVSLISDMGTLDVAGEGTEWWLSGFTRGDPDRVDALILGLLDLHLDQYLDRPDPIRAPKFRVVVETADGTTQELRVGEATPMGQLLELPSGALGTAIPETLALLGQGPPDLGVSHAFGVDPEWTEEVRITVEGRTWETTRNGPAWAVAGSDDPGAAEAVSRLGAVRVVYMLQAPPPPDDVWATVEVLTRDVRRVIDIGGLLEGQDAGYRSAIDRGGGSPFRIADAEVSFFADL